MRVQIGRVDHDHLRSLGLRGQIGHDPSEHTHPVPRLPEIVEGLRRTAVRRRILPSQTILLYECSADQHPLPVGATRAARFCEQRPHSLELRFRQSEQFAHDPSHFRSATPAKTLRSGNAAVPEPEKPVSLSRKHQILQIGFNAYN